MERREGGMNKQAEIKQSKTKQNKTQTPFHTATVKENKQLNKPTYFLITSKSF